MKSEDVGSEEFFPDKRKRKCLGKVTDRDEKGQEVMRTARGNN